MKAPMTLEEFAQARISFGGDIAAWPDMEQVRARRLMETPEGAHFLEQEQMLDTLIKDAVAQPMPAEGTGAFLGRLLDIPGEHSQSLPSSNVGFFSFLRGFGRDIRAAFPPVGLVTQGVGYALVLVAGVFVGLQQPSTTDETLDLSASLFSSSTNFYLEEQ